MVSNEQLERLELDKINQIARGEKAGVLDITDKVDQAIEHFKIAFWKDYATDREAHAYALIYGLQVGSIYLGECAQHEIKGRKGSYQRTT